jgi:external thioesterase TEII
MKKTQLFLLHFAGGNCYSFQFLKPLLPEFEVITLELPGRGKRLNEPLLKDFGMAAEDIFRQMNTKLNASPFLIYGHSMGAYLALRVASMLAGAGSPPVYLIVSGNAGPGVKYEDEVKKRYLLSRDEFIEELKILGGVPEELLENRELFNFFEPVLRADFQIAENNGMANDAPVNVPLYAMMGSTELKTEEISNWGRFTTGRFNHEILEGGHFFIHQHPERIAAVIRNCYKNTATADVAAYQ